MSCCVPCKTETVYQNRKAEKKVEDDCKTRLELALAELVKYKTEAEEAKEKLAKLESKPCCPSLTIETITKVGDEAIITFSDCTYMKAPVEVTKGLDTEKPETIIDNLVKRVKLLEGSVKTLIELVDEQSKAFIKVSDLVKINSCGEEAPFLGVDVSVVKGIKEATNEENNA